MRESELAAIEARANAANISFAIAARTDVPALVAEVRRLRGLIRRVEYRGSSGSAYWYRACSWCSATSSDGRDPPHDDDCPAFTPEGEVK